MLYPLSFSPIPKPRIWGSTYIARQFHPQFPENKNIGESWELSGLEDNVSEVAAGFLEGNEINELIEVYMGDLVGEAVFQKFGCEFPLLVKILDINDYLSVQVHPNDELAGKRHNAYGKAEAWYVLHAEPDARIYMGFNRPMNPQEFLQRCQNNSLPETLHCFTPQAGDCFFIPPGTVHAAGGGLVIAEIQQVSDITYRVYDWGREYIPQTAREMHLELALDAIQWEAMDIPQPMARAQGRQELVDSPYFRLARHILNAPLTLNTPANDSFRILICTEGSMDVVSKDDEGKALSQRLNRGGLLLVPACIPQLHIQPLKGGCELLEAHIPN